MSDATDDVGAPGPDAGDGEKPTDKQDTADRWFKELAKADDFEAKWRERADKVVKRYRDERSISDSTDSRVAQFNILYANVQVLKGQMYQRTPVPDARRRFADKDPIGRQAALILQRALSYTTDAYDFDGVMSAVVEDALLPGRGVAQVKYKPTLDMAPQTDPATGQPVMGPDGNPVMAEQVVYEEVVCEYVEWKWFRMSPASRWAKVRWMAFAELLSRNELVAQFGKDIGNRCKLDWHPNDKEDEPDHARALVWTIWDKTARKVIVVCKGYPQAPLREIADPLKLEQFWPIPKPLYACTETTCSMIPVPEFVQYQDLAIELDVVTERISKLVAALRRRGVYDATQPELARLADLGDNMFIPAENIAALVEKGGLSNVYMEAPIEQIATVVLGLYQQRDQIKAVIYEVTGISDIVRGSTSASETLGAQQLKAQYSGTRIGTRQKEVAKLARDIMRLQAEVIAEHFSADTLKQMTGPSLWMIEQPGMQGMPAQKIDVTQQIMELLRSDKLRGFRVDIETDSTIQPKAEEEQKNRVEFLTAVTSYIAEVSPLVAQGAIPLDVAKEFLSFGARGFKVTPQLEEAIDKLGGGSEDGASAMGGGAQQQQQQAMQQQMQEQMQQAQQQVQADQQQVQQKAQDVAMREMELKYKGEALAMREQMNAKMEEVSRFQADTEQERERESALASMRELLSDFKTEAKLVGAKMAELRGSEDGERESDDANESAGMERNERKAEMDMLMQSMAMLQQSVAEAMGQAVAAFMTPKQLVKGPDGSKRVVPVQQ